MMVSKSKWLPKGTFFISTLLYVELHLRISNKIKNQVRNVNIRCKIQENDAIEFSNFYQGKQLKKAMKSESFEIWNSSGRVNRKNYHKAIA